MRRFECLTIHVSGMPTHYKRAQDLAFGNINGTARSFVVSNVRQLGLIVLTTWPAIVPKVPFLPDDVAQGTQNRGN